MNCRDCINNIGSYNTNCRDCMLRWHKRLTDENHKKMLAEAMKEKFK